MADPELTWQECFWRQMQQSRHQRALSSRLPANARPLNDPHFWTRARPNAHWQIIGASGNLLHPGCGKAMFFHSKPCRGSAAKDEMFCGAFFVVEPKSHTGTIFQNTQVRFFPRKDMPRGDFPGTENKSTHVIQRDVRNSKTCSSWCAWESSDCCCGLLDSPEIAMTPQGFRRTLQH